MKFDLLGRLDNLRLPDGREAIYLAIFEAISNAKHAIEDAAPKVTSENGSIEIRLERDKDSGKTNRITVTDNGVGLTPLNLESFDTCDSRHKKVRGGKGVGRLIWLKIFSSIFVESRYLDGEKSRKVTFFFSPSESESLKDKISVEVSELRTGTAISFSEIGQSWSARIKPEALAKKIAYHFLPEFISGGMPRIEISEDGGPIVNVADIVSGTLEPQETSSFSITANDREYEISLEHIYLPRQAGKDLINKILLVGHGRVVEEIEIEQKFALAEMQDGRAYLGILRSDFLNERVDQTRTRLIFSPDQDDAIKKKALELVGVFLSPFLESIQKQQKVKVEEILSENPQLSLAVQDMDKYVQDLPPSMSKEQIGQNLFTLLYRREQSISADVKSLSGSDDITDEIEQKAKALLEKVSQSAQYRLAGYLVKRREILNVVRKFLRKVPDGSKYVPERAIHGLICPMSSFYTKHDYAKHNLWIVDDSLAYYQFFASDKEIQSFAVDTESKSEPDIVFFNPSGFRRAGTNDPAVIIEFKRPGDEKPSSDPVVQVLTYIEKLRAKTVKAPDGEVIQEIDNETPFHCIIVMSLTETARSALSRSLAHNPTPDKKGYFGYSPHHRASLLVIDYEKMLKDAEMRNLAFFRELGLHQIT